MRSSSISDKYDGAAPGTRTVLDPDISMEPWYRIEGVEWPRRRGCPFEGRGASAPGVVSRPPVPGKVRIKHAHDEDDCPSGGDVGADRGPPVPVGEGFGIVDVAARHARKAQEVLREEQHVGADEGEPEVQFTERLVVHIAGHFREPVVPT